MMHASALKPYRDFKSSESVPTTDRIEQREDTKPMAVHTPAICSRIACSRGSCASPTQYIAHTDCGPYLYATWW